MIKKNIAFENYNGQKESDDFLFNLTKAELIELEVSNGVNGLSALMEKLSKEQENGKILQIFKSIIDMSYGVKSDDGKRFIKNPEILEKFQSSGAYSELIMEFFTNEDAIAQFIVGLMPAEVGEKIGLKPNATAEELRSAALAAKGGFNKKQEAPKAAVQQVPELPTVSSEAESTEPEVKKVGTNGETIIAATAPPVFQEDLGSSAHPSTKGVTLPQEGVDYTAKPATNSIDTSGLTAEQKLELFHAGKITAGQL